ncbi:MAG: metal-sensitive transcriptional regulator [Bacteroidetes bacterium]|nr:MAG: metal-sensitive transcriptional regulator [Bacteroidota bacterium]
MIPKDLTRDVKKRLKNLQGHLQGIVHMLDEGKDPELILHQFKAATNSLQKAHFLFLDEVYRKALALKIVNLMDTCPGNCGQEEKIEFIRNEFPHLKLEELSKKLHEILLIEQHLSQLQDGASSQEEGSLE